jgi:GNAT superfamily N-acetyltransferase
VGFSIETYDEGYLEGMTALYNEQTACEAHIAPLDPERFVKLVQRKSYFDPEGLLVAVEADQVVGWVHACVAPGSEGRHDPHVAVPRISMLVYPPERLKVGAALVAEATSWLCHCDYPRVLAMHAQEGYPFYRGLWLGGEPMCPATMAHLQLALEVAGYKNTQESVFMVARMGSRPPELGAGQAVEVADSPAHMAHEPMRESWIGFEPMATTAHVGGEPAGSISWVVLPHVADRLGAPCMNIWGLGVGEQHRRKGIATALVSHAMALSYAEGARFASVGTQLWNAPAHATYGRLGFVPHCVLVGRTLKLDKE